MKEPLRWRDAGAEDGAPSGARELLRAGRAPRRMNAGERGRMERHVARVAAVPVAVATTLWLKGLAVAGAVGLSVAGVAVVTSAVRARATSAQAESRATRPAPRVPAPRAGATTTDARSTAEASARAPATSAAAQPARVATTTTTTTTTSNTPVRVRVASAQPTAAAPANAPQPLAPASVESAPPAPAARDTSAGAAIATASEAPVAPGAAASPAAASADAAPAEEPDIVVENDLLTRAQGLLIARDPAGALALAQQHAARFPRGQMASDRERIAIEALVHQGRRDEARARAERFFRAFAGDIHTDRVRSLVAPAP